MTLTLSVLLLLLGLCRSTISEELSYSAYNRSDGPRFKLPSSRYETKDFTSPAPINSLFQMVHMFLHVVQPNVFPVGILRKIAEKKFELSMDYGKVLQYEFGILLCAILGLLFVIFMPLVGLCFGVCRLYNKCGGEMHQRQKRNEPFMRKYYALSLLVLCLVMSVGIICSFVANQYITTHIKKIRPLADSNFRDLRTFLNETGPQLDYVLTQYTNTKNRAFSDLDNIQTLLGGDIQDHIRPRAFLVLHDIRGMAEEIKETSQLLLLVNKNLVVLNLMIEGIYGSLQEVKRDLARSLNDSTCSIPSVRTECESILVSLNHLDSNINLNRLRVLNKEVDHINVVLKTNLSSQVLKGYDSIENIPDRVQNQTTGIVSAVKKILDDIGLNIKTLSQKVPIQEKVSVLLSGIDQLERDIHRALPRLEKYDSYRWLGSLIICCLLTLIMIFYYLGLLCGVLGYKQNATPITRGRVSNTGGIFLMVGVGVSFFFCWIFMLFVTLTFVIGANMERLICESHKHKELFQIMDTPYLLDKRWKYYLSGLLLKNPDIAVTFEQVYSDCVDNKGFYTSLQLENIYNVSEHLSVKQYIRHMNAEFKKMNLDLHTVLINSEGRKSLLQFSASGLDQINYDTYLAEIGKPITKVKLLTYSYYLKTVAEKLPTGDLRNSLEWNANEIRDLYVVKVTSIELELKDLHDDIKRLQKRASGLRAKVTKIVNALDATQKYITKELPSIISRESKEFADIIISYFEHYLNWAQTSVTRKIAACKPLATALDSVVDVFLCKYLTKPMNLLWYGVGKATILLLPAIIIAVKLAKYYRRMDSEDVYDDLHKTASQPV